MPGAGPCHFCGRRVEYDRIGFRDECPHCGRALHACVQCARYAPGRKYDCAEPQAEQVIDKEANNRCEWFAFGDAVADRGLDRSAADEMLRKLLGGDN